LNRAGCEPVTHACVHLPEVWVERFGGTGAASCDITLDGDSILSPLRFKPRATEVLRVEGN